MLPRKAPWAMLFTSNAKCRELKAGERKESISQKSNADCPTPNFGSRRVGYDKGLGRDSALFPVTCEFTFAETKCHGSHKFLMPFLLGTPRTPKLLWNLPLNLPGNLTNQIPALDITLRPSKEMAHQTAPSWFSWQNKEHLRHGRGVRFMLGGFYAHTYARICHSRVCEFQF